MVSYHAPTEPSALRVATWRALKQLGAVKLGDGLYFLPHTPDCVEAVEALQQRIQGGGGDALVVTASGLGPVDEAFLSESFMEARADEFAQVQRWAQRLVEHIGREESTDDYRFAEVDTLEEEMEKLRRQFQRVAERDYLGSPARQAAAAVLSEAAQRLSAYVDEAFRKENGLSQRATESPTQEAGPSSNRSGLPDAVGGAPGADRT
jgi:Protein ChrB, N-terminal